MILIDNYQTILRELIPYHASLVAVSKTKPVDDILELMNHGQLIFGENYVHELIEKQNEIKNAEWHFIGHLQTNKVKQISGICNLIHSIDSIKLLKQINQEAEKQNRIQSCLLQVHIAEEETKFGFASDEVFKLVDGGEINQLKNISVKGLMGMASLSDDESKIKKEYKTLRKLFENFMTDNFSILSMGMTGDYKIALAEGSTMVRIGSAIFGSR